MIFKILRLSYCTSRYSQTGILCCQDEKQLQSFQLVQSASTILCVRERNQSYIYQYRRHTILVRTEKHGDGFKTLVLKGLPEFLNKDRVIEHTGQIQPFSGIIVRLPRNCRASKHNGY